MSEYTRRFDAANKYWSAQPLNNKMFLQVQQNWANDRLAALGHVFLNEIHDVLGFNRTPRGQLVGWLKEKGSRVDFSITEVEDEPGVFILNLNPDGIMYDKI